MALSSLLYYTLHIHLFSMSYVVTLLPKGINGPHTWRVLLVNQYRVY